jgi:glycosyltransferase involved in cell wall biosynthesis
MKKNIALGVLAYNVSEFIETVIDELSLLNENIYILDDGSNDETLSKIKKIINKHKNIVLIKNSKNSGAGYSTKKLILKAYEDGYDFLIKIDGDGQFLISDVKNIINLYNQTDYQFIKSNRFWKNGIVGKIPKKRLFGNLFATMLLQIVTGTNKLFDPLNGLFGVSTIISPELNKFYPKRYGYPFYITVVAIVNEFKTFQINNVVKYENQKSSLNPFVVLFTLLKLSLYFYLKKIKLKKFIGIYQRSAFLDKIFIFLLVSNIFLFIGILYLLNFAVTTIVAPRTLLFIFVLSLILNIIIFILSFKEEKSIRNTYIHNEI